MYQDRFCIFAAVILPHHLNLSIMNKKFCLITKVFISKTSEKPFLVRESFIDSITQVQFADLADSLMFLFGSSSVVMFEISSVPDMLVK